MAPWTILIVDDEPEVRVLVRRALRKQEFRVLEAANGLEALCVCACHPVDLVLADLEMPGLGGPQLVEKFSHPFPGVPVIYLSGRTDPGRGDALAKPLQPEVLLRRIRQTLEAGVPRKGVSGAFKRPAAASGG